MAGPDHYRKAEELTAKAHEYLGQGKGQTRRSRAPKSCIDQAKCLPPCHGGQRVTGSNLAVPGAAQQSADHGSSRHIMGDKFPHSECPRQ